MLCSITKWFVSRKLDESKEMPSFFRSHLQKCTSCREFERTAQLIRKRAVSDAATLLDKTPEGLSDRIKAHVFQQEGFRQEAYRMLKHRHSRWLIPAVSTLAAAALMAVILLVQPFQNQLQPPDGKEPSLFNTITRPAEKIKNVSFEMESPYERELETLQKAAWSASRYVLDKIDLRFGS